MNSLDLYEAIDTMLKKFGRPVIYRRFENGQVTDKVITVCMSVRTRISSRIEPYELATAGLMDRTGYQVLIKQDCGFIPKLDDLIIVPKVDNGKIVQPLTIIDCLRVTNVSDVVYEGTLISFNVYCVRDERLRGALGAKS